MLLLPLAAFWFLSLLASAAVAMHTFEAARLLYLMPGLSLANFTGWNPVKFGMLHTALCGEIDMILAPGAPQPLQRIRFTAYCMDNEIHMENYRNEIMSVASLRFSKYPAKIHCILENQNMSSHLLKHFSSINGSQAQVDKIHESCYFLDRVHIIFSEYFPHTLDDLLVVFADPRPAVILATYQLLEIVRDLRLVGMHHYMFWNVSFRFTHEQGRWQSLRLKLMDFETGVFESARRCAIQITAGPELNVCSKPIEGYTTYMFNVGETVLDLLHLYDKEFHEVLAIMPPGSSDHRIRAIKYMLMHGFKLCFRSLMPEDYGNFELDIKDEFFMQLVFYVNAKRHYIENTHDHGCSFPTVKVSRLEPVWGSLFVDLMERLIAFHPRNRITLDEAFVHPLFDELYAGSCPASRPLPHNVCRARSFLFDSTHCNAPDSAAA